MALEEATEDETRAMSERANRFLAMLWKQEPSIKARDVVETLGIALRLIYIEAQPEFRREMLKYLAANLAEMPEADA